MQKRPYNYRNYNRTRGCPRKDTNIKLTSPVQIVLFVCWQFHITFLSLSLQIAFQEHVQVLPPFHACLYLVCIAFSPHISCSNLPIYLYVYSALYHA